MKSASLRLKKNKPIPLTPNVVFTPAEGPSIALWRCIHYRGTEIWQFRRGDYSFDLYFSPTGRKVTLVQS